MVAVLGKCPILVGDQEPIECLSLALRKFKGRYAR